MKNIIGIALIMLSLLRVAAQTNAPVQLALIADTSEASMPVDVLTAQLSGNPRIRLLERDAINKVLQEQGVSAANRNDLKLGRTLGADGVVLLAVVRTPQATHLLVRLTAVKPGVILTEASFAWPIKDVAGWSTLAAAGLDRFLPKLALPPQAAIPVSVVNLRSAVQSDEARETEQQLKLLTILRLSAEPQLFVLERQKLQLLGEEKALKSDESVFWDGSYLIEGVVDQNGYSKETVTINARLTPPKGGGPILLEIRGSRTNLAEVINEFAGKIIAALQIQPVSKAWNAADEATQYFDEAGWALRWGDFAEAQAAADSAWALGKHDQDCAVARIKAYETPLHVGGFRNGEFTNPGNTNVVIETAVAGAAPNQPWGLILHEQVFGKSKSVKYAYALQFPDPASIDLATHALEIYYEYSRNSPEGLIKVASQQTGGKNSEWYNLGIEDLVAAATVLQQFNFVPESQKPAGEKLAELRRSARTVADWICQSPPVHDSYFVGDRLAPYDELANTLDENPNIFRCKVLWGCYWQEQPEDAIAAYRELIASPVFCYIHSDFWLRELQQPRLVAWNQADAQRIPQLWGNFLNELAGSSNVLERLEAKALALADSANDRDVAVAFTNLFQTISENRDELVQNPADILYLDWHLNSLVSARTGSGILTEQLEALNQLYSSQYEQQLMKMDIEYQTKTVRGAQFSSDFKKQEQYLRGNEPFDFVAFVTLFQLRDYTESQAAEIEPLIVAYKSNLVAQFDSASGMQKSQLMGPIGQVDSLERDVNRILNQPAPKPVSQPAAEPPPVNVSKVAGVSPVEKPAAPEIVSNVITVKAAFTIPVERLLPPGESWHVMDSSMVTVTAHHWCAGKLLLDFTYDLFLGEGNDVTQQMQGQAVALFDPATKQWELVPLPATALPGQSRYYHRTTVLNGTLYNCDGGQIRKYDPGARQWHTLKISDGNNYQLFAVNGKLYAANGTAILEIVDGGDETRLLAGSRRRPAVSVLDTEDLGTPVLFQGPNHSLRVATATKIFTLAGDDWSAPFAAPPASFGLETTADGSLFRFTDSPSQGMRLSFLPVDASAADLLLSQEPAAQNSFSPPHQIHPFIPRALSPPPKSQSPEPRWALPANLYLAALPSAVRPSELYLLRDHSRPEIANGKEPWAGNIGNKYLPQDGYEAALLCFSRDQPLPEEIYLNFDAPDSCQPLAGEDPNPGQWKPAPPPSWIIFAGDYLVFGLEKQANPMYWVGSSRTDLGGKASIWLMPISQLADARAAHQKIQPDQP